MFLSKTLLFAAVLAVVNSKSITDVRTPYTYVEDRTNIIQDDIEDMLSEQPYESIYPIHDLRIKRQVHGLIKTNSDGSSNVLVKFPLADSTNNMLSGTGSLDGIKPEGSFSSVGAGLALDNVNGHSLSISGKHIPDFGNQLTADGKVNLLNTDLHNLNANVFTTRNMPSISNGPNFSTHGTGVDYMYNDKVGASLGVAYTPLFQKTDLFANGNLNLYKDKSSSLDFSAGAHRSFSPFIPKSSWEPRVGLTFSKYF